MKLFALALFATALAACGELNNDDIVFLRGTPTAEELRIDVEQPGTNAAALTSDNAVDSAGGIGAPAAYYDLVAKSSMETNANVESVLDFIDSIGRSYEPTKRTTTSRVWGPFPNFEDRHFTLRYEINRSDAGFRYCLHVGPDAAVTGEPSCDDIPSGFGMTAIIYGSYVPSASDTSVRNSDGQVAIDFEASYAMGFGDATDRGTLAITHAYADAGATKSITIDALTPQDNGPTATLHYAYTHDVSGRISYDLTGQFDAVDTTPALEDLTITSCWHDAGPGLANVGLSGGDLEATSSATVIECWDTARDRSYVSVAFPQTPAANATAGNVAACPPPACP